MRLIQYTQTIQEGYCIFNTTDASYVDDHGDYDGPGIKISLTKPDEVEKVATAFHSIFGEVEKDPDFDDHYRQLLRGEDSPWKLIDVKIHNNTLNLELVHESLLNEYRDDEYDVVLQRALTATVLLVPSRFTTGLQFIVPHKDGTESEVIEVNFHSYTKKIYPNSDNAYDHAFVLHPEKAEATEKTVEFAVIKESTGALRRDICLYDGDPHSNDYRAEITERWI